METIRTINGNRQPKIVPVPRLAILTEREWNDVALAHVFDNTGLNLIRTNYGYEVQPNTSNQIVALLLTYNFKTQYHDNGTTKNTIYLKDCNNEGFKVDSICFDCVEANHIHLSGLPKDARLAV